MSTGPAAMLQVVQYPILQEQAQAQTRLVIPPRIEVPNQNIQVPFLNYFSPMYYNPRAYQKGFF